MDQGGNLVPHSILIGLNHCGSAANAELDTWQYRFSRESDFENSTASKVIFSVLETDNKRNVYKRMSTCTHTPLAKQWGVWAETVGSPAINRSLLTGSVTFYRLKGYAAQRGRDDSWSGAVQSLYMV